MKIPILCVSPSYPPRLGGGERYAQRTNAAFVAAGAHVQVLTAVKGVTGRTTIDGVDVEYAAAPWFAGFPWFGIAAVVRLWRRERPRFSLAYGPSPYDVVAAATFRLLGCPFVQVYHADFNNRRLVTRFVTWLHNTIALRSCAAIVCTNERMVRTLAERGFSDRTIVSTPGIDRAFFERPVGSGGDILFVAALDDAHEYKRLDLLLEAVAQVRASDPAVRLRVVGDGNRRGGFERRAQDLGIANCTEFLGAVSDEELTALYASSAVMVLPSPTTQEGYGLVCLEAMAAGLPVVCSVNAGAAALVASAPGCAVWNAREVSDLARAIGTARLVSGAERRELREFVRPFEWNAMGRRLLEEICAKLPDRR